VLWATVTIHQNGLIGYTQALGLQCKGWRCENLSSRSFYINLEERRKKVRIYDTTRPWGSTQLRGSKSRTERVRLKVGKDRVCIFGVWQDEMKMGCCRSTPGSPEYILHIAHSTSVTPASPYTHRHSFTIYLEAEIEPVLEMHLEAEIEWTERCTGRPRWSEFRDALGGRDRSSLEMHWEAVIDRVWRCTGRLWWSEFVHALGGRDRVNSDMHSEGVTERVWRCTCRVWSSEIGGVLGGGRFGGRRDGSWVSIHWLTCNCGNVESWVQHPLRDEKLAGSGRLLILG